MSDGQIIQSIQQIAGTFNADIVHLITAEVDSVNIASRSCSVTTISGKNSTALENVELMAAIDDGILFVPSIGSTVKISYSNYNSPFIVQYSEVDQILFISGSSQVSIVDGKIMLNDGSYGGLIQVEKLVEKLNNLENLVNDLAAKFTSHIHVLTLTSGSGTSAPTASSETTTLITTQRADIENNLIQHGK
ncbi:MAG: hypothetical protein M3Z26_00585 [Bacteroidota bacterium]|nr:hypothetical protein [Bacteroidota bacterium]